MSEGKERTLSLLAYAEAGAVSGFVTRFCCQPLDVLKIVFQLQADSKTTSKYTSILQASQLIVKEEGITALWKGHVPAQCLSIAFGAIQFSSYEKLTIMGNQWKPSNSGHLLSPTAMHFYAGAVSGVTAIALSFPFDTIRTRLVAQTKSKAYTGMLDAAKQIWIHEHAIGFFRGLIPACIQIAPSSGLTFGFKNIYTQIWNVLTLESPDSFQVTAQGHLITGLLAGITSKTIVYPLDVVKKRLQIQGMQDEHICINKRTMCNSFIQCLILIVKGEGFFGLYKGLFPAMMKAGLGNAINFTIYNEIVRLLDYVKR